MKEIYLNFKHINTKNKLFNYLEENFGLEPIQGGWGRNLDAFWDCYSYSKEDKRVIISNFIYIEDIEFKAYINKLIILFKDLTEVNSNFEYIIKS